MSTDLLRCNTGLAAIDSTGITASFGQSADVQTLADREPLERCEMMPEQLQLVGADPWLECRIKERESGRTRSVVHWRRAGRVRRSVRRG